MPAGIADVRVLYARPASEGHVCLQWSPIACAGYDVGL
jgi:hypothetical protein